MQIQTLRPFEKHEGAATRKIKAHKGCATRHMLHSATEGAPEIHNQRPGHPPKSNSNPGPPAHPEVQRLAHPAPERSKRTKGVPPARKVECELASVTVVTLSSVSYVAWTDEKNPHASQKSKECGTRKFNPQPKGCATRPCHPLALLQHFGHSALTVSARPPEQLKKAAQS